MKNILSSFFGLFTSTTAKHGVTLMKDGKAMTQDEIAAMGETADAHQALNDTFAASVDTQAKAIASLEARMKTYEEKVAAADKQAETIASLEKEVEALKAEQKAAAEKLEASQKQVVALAQEHNKGKTTPIVSTPITPDGGNKMVEKADMDTVVQSYHDAKLAAEMEANAQKAKASQKTYPIK